MRAVVETDDRLQFEFEISARAPSDGGGGTSSIVQPDGSGLTPYLLRLRYTDDYRVRVPALQIRADTTLRHFRLRRQFLPAPSTSRVSSQSYLSTISPFCSLSELPGKRAERSA